MAGVCACTLTSDAYEPSVITPEQTDEAPLQGRPAQAPPAQPPAAGEPNPVDGSPVDLQKLPMPLLVITGTKDTIAAPASSLALLDKVPSTDKHALSFEGGHIGLTTSRRALRDLWPRAADWMLAR